MPFVLLWQGMRDELGKQRYLAYCNRHGVEPQQWETLDSAFRLQWQPEDTAVQRKPVQMETAVQHPARKTG